MRYLALLAVTLSAAVPLASADLHAGAEVLQRRCIQCHGEVQTMGGLDLSTPESALSGGTRGPAIVPSDPAGSLLLARVTADEMPPGSPLSALDKKALSDWIAAGAPWPGPIEERRAGPDWWSFQPLGNDGPPGVGLAPPEWQQSPIDRWINASLGSAGIRAAAVAGRRQLIRRVTFSVTGLPPDPAEVAAFVADKSPNAYERVVDRLLASPQYGERWARHWLDVVRFSESEGFERDLPRDHVWPYRDYVIRSLNADKPYLQFAREQIAGDVLDPVTKDGVAASTMLTLGPLDAIGLTSAVWRERAMVREDLLEEMVGTVSQAFLGLTVNCARCHDHKFDPIRQEEYYRMKAAFQAVWPPTRPVPSAGLDSLFPHGRPLLSGAAQRARDRLVGQAEREMDTIRARLGDLYRLARPPEVPSEAPRPFARWTFDTDGRADFAPLHLRLVGRARVSAGSFGLRAMAGTPDGTDGQDGESEGGSGVGVSQVLAVDLGAKTLEAWLDVRSVPETSVTLMELRSLSGYRGASVDGIRFVAGSEPRWENFSIGQFRSRRTGSEPESLQPGERLQMVISYEGNGTISLYRNGEPLGQPYRPDAGVPAGRLQVYRAGDALVRFPASADLRVAEARLYDRALAPGEIWAAYRAGMRDFTREDLADRMEPAERDRLATLEGRLAELAGRLRSIPKPELVHGVTVGRWEPTRLLLRGSVDRPGKQVRPAGLECVKGPVPDFRLPADASEGARRRAMAEWVANEANPLFSRVIANRIWLGHFGQGLVSNPSDFGYNGGQPTHPGLLDWLASELVRSGWSLKHLHKRILMSQTYRQSSRFDGKAAVADGGNRLLWRYPQRRLEAEAVRDAMLAVSGDLNREFHGPSFRPFVFGEAKGSLMSYVLTGDDAPEFRRRTIYRMNVITGGDPMLESLDCPLPSTKTPHRRTTTTALQALSLMNNAFVQHRSRGFADRLRRHAAGLDGQVRRAFELALGRSPDPRELAASRDLAATSGLEALCWGLFNTSEFLYVR